MRVKRIGGNILGSVVDARSRSLLLMIRPVRCEDFERFSAQKEIKGFAQFLIQDLVQKFIKIGSLPSAVGKSAAGVLFRRAGSLDNAIDCDKAQENQFSHIYQLLLTNLHLHPPGGVVEVSHYAPGWVDLVAGGALLGR